MLTRRELNLSVIAAGLSAVDKAAADDEAYVSDQAEIGAQSWNVDARNDAGVQAQDSSESTDWINGKNDPRGLICRAPDLAGQDLSPSQKIGTGTADKPMPIGVPAGDFAPELGHRTFAQDAEGFLERAIQTLKEVSTYLGQDAKELFNRATLGAFDPHSDNQLFQINPPSILWSTPLGTVEGGKDPEQGGLALYTTPFVAQYGFGGVYSTFGVEPHSGPYGIMGPYTAAGAYLGLKLPSIGKLNMDADVYAEVSTSSLQLGVRLIVIDASVGISAEPMMIKGDRALQNIQNNMIDYNRLMTSGF